MSGYLLSFGYENGQVTRNGSACQPGFFLYPYRYYSFRGGLRDLSGFSRIILIYAFHRSRGFELEVIPFLDTVPHGIFATRAPRRPNAIGLSIVGLISVNNGELIIEGVDILDGTPVLDIKPYVPEFDCYPDEKSGWFASCKERVVTVRADRRFCKE